MKIVLLTSDRIRHKYFARRLGEAHELRLVVAEEKGGETHFSGRTRAEADVLAAHFQQLEMEQARFFGSENTFGAGIPRVMAVHRGSLNTAAVVEAIRQAAPEAIVVFGPGIVGPEILDTFPVPVINAHQGLSPYLRGSGTNFWPFVTGELHYVGVTVHYVDAGIDTGGIICHGRPALEPGDSLHRIGCKTVALSAELVGRVLDETAAGRPLAGLPQWMKGRYYRRGDFTAEAVLQARKNMAEGLVASHLQRLARGTLPRLQLIDLV